MAIKIMKSTLKRLIKNNLINRFMLVPSKCDYRSGCGVEYTSQDIDNHNGETLERRLQNLINSFEYYNCRFQTGYYSLVYIHDKYADLLIKKKAKETKLTNFKEEINK